jgi:hypothetical protein
VQGPHWATDDDFVDFVNFVEFVADRSGACPVFAKGLRRALDKNHSQV